MEELARRFRRGAEQRPGLRYSQDLQRLAMEYAAMGAARGESLREVAEALDLCPATLLRWQKEAIPGSSTSLHEVVVVESSETAGPVLVMPSGARVEGLCVRDLIVVLEALG